MDSLLSFPVGLFHPLQHAGLSRRSPSSRQPGSCRAVARIEMLCAVTSTCGASGGIESEMLNEVLHFVPVGTRRFNSSNQFSTTLICVGAAPVCSLGLSIRERWPSGETS
jgi:hypothetical protein